MAKRKNYISWDEYFMGVALLSAMRSKDPNTQVGACIVNADNRIVSVGYNGFPRGCSDEDFPWERTADNPNDTKYPFVCHAELNAILNSNGIGVKGARIYVALFPCNECAKAIIQAGISEVIYISDKYSHTDNNRASRRMLEAAGIKLTKFSSDIKIQFDFNPENV
ncbi:MAG: dCMP deaminase family protein [Clostridiales bacterium]|nr:dCMP deaminase family protein [Clostridiales bacterium]